MSSRSKLLIVKLIHTLIWVFFVSVIFYVVYSGAADKVTFYTWICIALIFLEGIVLTAFQMRCPLTVVARRYSDSEKDNFDIFLPEGLARYNKQIFTAIFLIGLILVILRCWQR